jgi:hypothetical protein
MQADRAPAPEIKGFARARRNPVYWPNIEKGLLWPFSMSETANAVSRIVWFGIELVEYDYALLRLQGDSGR